MKNYIKYIPLTAFAAAFVLGGSLSANETGPEGTGMREHQRQSQQPDRTGDETARESTIDQANSHPMTASEVLGMNIDSADNDKIGEIDEIYIDSDTGEVLAIVVSTGGLFGIRQQQSLISPEDLRINAERSLMQTNVSKDQIKEAPRYRKGETSGFDQVRPLGKTASDGKARTERTDRSKGERHASDRQSTGEARTERSEGGQPQVPALAVSKLIGMSVENRQGESVGDVDEAFLDLENWEVAGVVVSTGGFLGMSDRKTLFGLEEMSFETENETAFLDYDRDQISEFPEFKPDEQSVFEDLRERMDRLFSRGNRSAGIQQ